MLYLCRLFIFKKRSMQKNEIILYQPEGNITIEVRVEDETVWLSLDLMAELFQRDKSTISRHIKNIFSEGELRRDSVVANFATTATDGKTYQMDYYNLDVIISVGYRVKSMRGTQFRIWANSVLKDYILCGYAVNQRMELLGCVETCHETSLQARGQRNRTTGRILRPVQIIENFNRESIV